MKCRHVSDTRTAGYISTPLSFKLWCDTLFRGWNMNCCVAISHCEQAICWTGELQINCTAYLSYCNAKRKSCPMMLVVKPWINISEYHVSCTDQMISHSKLELPLFSGFTAVLFNWCVRSCRQKKTSRCNDERPTGKTTNWMGRRWNLKIKLSPISIQWCVITRDSDWCNMYMDKVREVYRK